MNNLFLCKFKDKYKPILLISTIYYKYNQNIGKSIYLDMDNNNIITRYFEITVTRRKKIETMIMQDSSYEYDLTETANLPYKSKEKFIINITSDDLFNKIKEKLTFTPDEIKKLNEYRFGIEKKR